MKTRFFVIILIQMLSFSLWNLAQANGTRYSPQELTTDFDILHSALTSGDPGIYRYISPKILRHFVCESQGYAESANGAPPSSTACLHP